MSEGKIGIVTVLYNSEKVLQDFFISLNTQTYKNFILYVIDKVSEAKYNTGTERLEFKPCR